MSRVKSRQRQSVLVRLMGKVCVQRECHTVTLTEPKICSIIFKAAHFRHFPDLVISLAQMLGITGSVENMWQAAK